MAKNERACQPTIIFKEKFTREQDFCLTQRKRSAKLLQYETKQALWFLLFAAIDVNSNEIIAIYTSKWHSSLDALNFYEKSAESLHWQVKTNSLR